MAKSDIIGDVKVALDTDVVVAAMRSPEGASASILQKIMRGQVRMAATVALGLEYESVCMRAEHHVAADISAEDAAGFVDTMLAAAKAVDTHFLWRPQMHDITDDMVLSAAIRGRVDYLVTFNPKRFGDVPSMFGVEVLLPQEALKRIA